ncbi:MAG: hypothetical protein OEX77_10760 [Candidatus Bathyarchaeota archaeon]|nr:hypothetical protein [Candidatus Bathyarchaeota archaeon]
MVRLSTPRSMFLIMVSLLFISFSCIPLVYGPGTYHIEKQWIKIWINKNGTIDLFYNLTFVCDSGVFTWIRIGQPNKDFTIWSCVDEYDRNLTTTKIVDDWTGVTIFFKDAIQIGEKITILLLTNVDRMIWEDEMNPGNVALLFNATWWEVNVVDLRIAAVLPENVKKEEIVSGEIQWNETYAEEERWVAYWERSNLHPNEQFQIGVGFPEKYVDTYYSKRPWDWLGGVLTSLVLPVVAVSIIVVAAVVLFRNLRRVPYSKPGFSMEALGVRRGLTAVEAAILLDIEPRRILTMILFGLMRKGAVKIAETKPKLRLQVVSTAGLRYYEDWFTDAVVFESRAGTLSDERLSSLILKLLREVDKKIKYYCRADTVKHYQKTVEKAWRQVRKAGTPEVKAEVFNEEIEWLMMAPRFKSRVKRTFRRGEEIPVQSSWWLSYWATHYAPSRFRSVEGKPVTAQSLPGVQFANAAVTIIESTAGRIVTNLEAFSKSLIPVTPSAESKTSRAPVSRGGCVCACASCACACACASCACACASGGAG